VIIVKKKKVKRSEWKKKGGMGLGEGERGKNEVTIVGIILLRELEKRGGGSERRHSGKGSLPALS